MSFLVCLLLLLGPARAADPDAVDAWSDSVVRLVIGNAICSGVVLDDAGTVATAYHCVAGGRRPRVEARDGTSGVGRVTATAPRDDLALVSVPALAGKAPGRPLAEGEVRPGQALIAIGHPLGGDTGRGGSWEGMLGWAVSEGIVSAVGPRMIQTDTALNPGTSGGPVFDEDGAIVGIVSRKLSGEGLSFLAHVDRLRALRDAPRQAALGGTFAVGGGVSLPSSAEGATTLEPRLELAVRDHLVGGFAVGIPLDSRTRALDRGSAVFPSLGLYGGLRQRLGHGPWSTTVEAGGGLIQLADVTADWSERADGSPAVRTTLRPRSFGGQVYGRLGFGAGGLRATWLPATDPGWLLAVEVGWPGVLGTF